MLISSDLHLFAVSDNRDTATTSFYHKTFNTDNQKLTKMDVSNVNIHQSYLGAVHLKTKESILLITAYEIYSYECSFGIVEGIIF